MRRRGLLVAIGLLAGCSTTREPTGPLSPPPGGADGSGPGAAGPGAATSATGDATNGTAGGDDPGLSVSDWKVVEGPAGRLRVEATVANDATGERSGVLIAEGSAGGEPFERRREVTVAGGGTATVELVVDVAYDAWEGDGTLRLVVEQG